MFEEKDALVACEQQFAFESRNSKMGLRDCPLDMGRHVVGTFRVVTVERGVFQGLFREEVFQIAQDVQVFVFLDEKGRRCMTYEERQQPGRQGVGFGPVPNECAR